MQIIDLKSLQSSCFFFSKKKKKSTFFFGKQKGNPPVSLKETKGNRLLQVNSSF